MSRFFLEPMRLHLSACQKKSFAAILLKIWFLSDDVAVRLPVPLPSDQIVFQSKSVRMSCYLNNQHIGVVKRVA